MTRTTVGSSPIGFASCAAFAQTAPAPLSFEVASLKPAASPGTQGTVNALTRQLARPVLDQTELTAAFNVDISWMPDEMDSGNARTALSGAMPGAMPGGPGGPGGDGPRTGGPEPAITLAQASHEKLGLKSDARKSSAEILIIGRAEKVPVEN